MGTRMKEEASAETTCLCHYYSLLGQGFYIDFGDMAELADASELESGG